MKRIYLLVFLCFLSNNIIGQEEEFIEVEIEEVAEEEAISIAAPDLSLKSKPTHTYINDTLWFSYDWKVVKNKQLAHYYRTKPIAQDNLYLIKDYYLDGTLQMQGTFIDFDGTVKHGLIEYYRPNNTLENKVYYENNKFKNSFNKDNSLQLLERNTYNFIKLNLPNSIKKKEINNEETNFSFQDLFNTDKQLRAELNIDESIYITKEEGNVITTIERKTNRVVSKMQINRDKTIEGNLKLYDGSTLAIEIKPNPKSKEYELIRYHKNGNPFFRTTIKSGHTKYFSPKGEPIAENDGESGSFILGLDKKRILGFSYISPIEEGQSFIISYIENGDLLYSNQYYSYNVPYRIFDKASGYTKEYKEDGTVISEYVNPNKKASLYNFGLEDKLTKGYRSTLYKSKRLKTKSYFEPKAKIVEHFRDNDSKHPEYKEYYKKEKIDGIYGSPYRTVRYNEKGIKVFEEEIKDRNYLSTNYNDKGKVIGQFSGDYMRTLNTYPDLGNDQDGYLLKSYETNTYDMFRSPEYEDINAKVTFELIYEKGIKKREFLSINNVVFIDYNWNGKSKFYNPIKGEIVTSVFKEGQVISGEYVEYSVSYNNIKLTTIEQYKNETVVYKVDFKDQYDKGTYYTHKVEKINNDDIITTYLNGTEYKYNKTKKDGKFVGKNWDIDKILNDKYTFHDINSDLCIAEFKNGDLLNIKSYQSRFFNNRGRETPNTEHFLLTNKSLYNNGKLIALESFYDPDSEFKNIRNKLVLKFKDELPYSGEVFINAYDDEYYRLENGTVIQKLKTNYKEFYEVTPNTVKVKYLKEQKEITYNMYFQVIEYRPQTETYTYTAVDPEGKEHEAIFDGNKMKKGIFYYEKSYEGMYTLIVKDNKVYKVDKYISPKVFNSTLAVDSIPVSSSYEAFDKFYGFYSFSSPLQINKSDYGDLELKF